MSNKRNIYCRIRKKAIRKITDPTARREAIAVEVDRQKRHAEHFARTGSELSLSADEDSDDDA